MFTNIREYQVVGQDAFTNGRIEDGRSSKWKPQPAFRRVATGRVDAATNQEKLR